MRVIDGDTLTVWLDGGVESVRLLYIDTPEVDEYGHNRAGAALKELVGRGPVRLEGERPGELARDAFGRLLAYVYVGDMCANIEMVRKGWSLYWTVYGESRLAGEFQTAQAQARSAGRGIWGLEKHGEED